MKLLACNSNPNLSKLIAKNLGLELVDAEVKKFSDKEIFVEIKENVRGEDIFVIQSTSFPANDNLMEVLIAIDALRRASAKRITVVMPYFGYARQDRKSASRTPITAKLVANLITTSGADRVLTIDLHAGQIQGFFDIPLDNLYAAPVFVKDIKANFNLDDLVIVSPDVGGLVRARAIASKTGSELAIVDKRRPKAGVSEVMNIIGDVENKNCLIVDDMVDSGGTLCNAADALINKGAKSVCAYITHGILSGKAHDKIGNSQLEKLVITNSIEPTQQTLDTDNIKIIDISDLLAKAIYNIAEETSVSTLFD